MRVSELNSKIDFILEESSGEPFGGTTEKVIASNIWAKKIQKLGKETFELYATNNIVPVNFIVRTRTDINEQMKIKHENTYYNIIGYQPIKDDEAFMLIATTRIQ